MNSPNDGPSIERLLHFLDGETDEALDATDVLEDLGIDLAVFVAETRELIETLHSDRLLAEAIDLALERCSGSVTGTMRLLDRRRKTNFRSESSDIRLRFGRKK